MCKSLRLFFLQNWICASAAISVQTLLCLPLLLCWFQLAWRRHVAVFACLFCGSQSSRPDWSPCVVEESMVDGGNWDWLVCSLLQGWWVGVWWPHGVAVPGWLGGWIPSNARGSHSTTSSVAAQQKAQALNANNSWGAWAKFIICQWLAWRWQWCQWLACRRQKCKQYGAMPPDAWKLSGKKEEVW